MKRKGVVARRGLKEARSKHASRWTRTGSDYGVCHGLQEHSELVEVSIQFGRATGALSNLGICQGLLTDCFGKFGFN